MATIRNVLKMSLEESRSRSISLIEPFIRLCRTEKIPDTDEFKLAVEHYENYEFLLFLEDVSGILLRHKFPSRGILAKHLVDLVNAIGYQKYFEDKELEQLTNIASQEKL